MKYVITCLIWICILQIDSLQAQDKFTLSGSVTDQLNNETLIGVNIIVPELNTGTTTNEYGFYSITLPKGNYQIVISYSGFENLTDTIELINNLRENLFPIRLKECEF